MNKKLFDEVHDIADDTYPWTKSFIQAMWDGSWNAKKFNFHSDKLDFDVRFTDIERQVVLRTISAIVQVEVQVKRFWANLGKTLKHPSIESLGIVMANVEEVHKDAYEKLLNSLNLRSEISHILDHEVMRDRVDMLKKHNELVFEDDKKQFIYSLIIFTLYTENISLFSQFFIILALNRYKNVLKDTSQQIKYTRNEETLHARIGAKLINVLRNQYPDLFDQELENQIKKDTLSFYEKDKELISFILEGYDSKELNKNILFEFLGFKVNESLELIDLDPLIKLDSNISKDYMWINEGIYSTTKVDFFNSESVNYTQSDMNEDDDF